MVDYSICSLRTFLYLPESSVCDDPGKYKNLITNCVINKKDYCFFVVVFFFIFISIKKFHKA